CSYRYCCLCFIDSFPVHRELRSSPTRRSSDLPVGRDSVRCRGPTAPTRASCVPWRRWRGRRNASVRPTSTSVARSSSPNPIPRRSEEHTSELQSRENLVCRLLLEKKKQVKIKS